MNNHPDLEGKHKACQSLPSPPADALPVLEMVNDPEEVGIEKAVHGLFLDPAIPSRIAAPLGISM
ncbi:MAG: hypothetical protein V3T42_04125 [Nitrospirales bacterium]